MDEKEAIKKINGIGFSAINRAKGEAYEALQCLAAAAQKQIPKHPAHWYEMEDGRMSYDCECGRRLHIKSDKCFLDSTSQPNYCESCGQKIDWEAVNFHAKD